jgi:hypothetical protein
MTSAELSLLCIVQTGRLHLESLTAVHLTNWGLRQTLAFIGTFRESVRGMLSITRYLHLFQLGMRI